jgi:hypothetical protein
VKRGSLLVAAVLVASAALVTVTDGSRPSRLSPSFPEGRTVAQPYVPGQQVTTSWFCPGVPMSGEGEGGTLVVANPTDIDITGLVTAYADPPIDAEGQQSGAPPSAAEQTIVVSPRSTIEVDLAALQPTARFASALVELSSGFGFVEQIARHVAGDSVAACGTSTSTDWYFADGYTIGGSTQELVVTNPYPGEAVVSFDVITLSEGPRVSPALQGLAIPGRSVLVVDQSRLPRDENGLGIHLRATRGQVVLGRAQRFLDQRLGFNLSLAAPSLTSQAYFVDGVSESGVIQRYSMLNLGDVDVQVSVFFYGQDVVTADAELTIPRRSIISFIAEQQFPELADGAYGVNFSSYSVAPDGRYAEFLVERSTTRQSDDTIATSVVLGSPGTFASTRWSMAIGAGDDRTAELVLLNVDSSDATVGISAVGTGGAVPIPGLEALLVTAGGVLSVPIVDPSAVGKPLIVQSTNRLFVERVLDRGDGGRVTSVPMPG